MKIIINSCKSSLQQSAVSRFRKIWTSVEVVIKFPKHSFKSQIFFLCLVLCFLVGNNIYASASLWPLLYCSNASSYLYFSDSIAARLCLHISILRRVSLQQVCSPTWSPSPTFCFHFWGYLEFDSAVGEKACRCINTKDEKLSVLCNSLKVFYWNLKCAQVNKFENIIWIPTLFNSQVSSPWTLPFEANWFQAYVSGSCILQHVWKWLSLWPAHGKQMFSKRTDSIPGSSQSVHNLSFQTYYPPPPYMLSHTKWSSKTHFAFSCLHSSLHFLFS